MSARPWYRLHLWTIFVGGVSLLFPLFTLGTDSERVSFSGKHTESGWPVVYRTRDYRNLAAFGTSLQKPGEPPREGYEMTTDSGIDHRALGIDLGVNLAVCVLPAMVCELVLRRRRRTIGAS